MFCGECGKLIKEGNKFCTGCGTKVEPISILNKSNDEEVEKKDIVVEKIVEPVKEEKNTESTTTAEDLKEKRENKVESNNMSNNNASNASEFKGNYDKVSVGLNILSFFIPLVGLILFVTMKNDTPKKAKSIGISALIGYILSMVVSIFLCIYMYGFVLPNLNKRYNNYPRYNRLYNIEIDRDFGI